VSSNIDFATVTNSIAALSISGVAVEDIHEVAAAIKLGTGILAPNPKNGKFVTGVKFEKVNVRGDKQNMTYTLNYVYYKCKIGGDIFAVFPGLIADLALIIKAFAGSAVLTGATQNGQPTVNWVGGVQDNAGNDYHGAELSITIHQFFDE
jgi:hypothetical protein